MDIFFEGSLSKNLLQVRHKRIAVKSLFNYTTFNYVPKNILESEIFWNDSKK